MEKREIPFQKLTEIKETVSHIENVKMRSTGANNSTATIACR